MPEILQGTEIAHRMLLQTSNSPQSVILLGLLYTRPAEARLARLRKLRMELGLLDK